MANYHGLTRTGMSQWELRHGERVAVIRRNGRRKWMVHPPGAKTRQCARWNSFLLMRDAITAARLAMSDVF
jgi:hypothetical protein